MARTPADVRLFYEALTGGRAHVRRRRRRASRSARTCTCTRSPPASSARSSAPRRRSTRSRWGSTEAERIYPAFVAIQSVEAALAHADLFPTRRAEYSEDVAARIERARTVTLEEYVEATATRERLRASFARVFAAADLLLTPIHALPPELRGVGAQSFRDAVLPYTVPQNLAGLPVVRRARRLRRARPAGRRPAHRPRLERGPRARRRRGAVQRDSIGEGGIRVDPVTCGIRIPISSSKHQHQSSPGSSERMIGCSGEA